MPTLQPYRFIAKTIDTEIMKNENAYEQLTLKDQDDSELQLKKIKLDWSSTTRKQMKKLQPDKLKPKITDLYTIIEQLDTMAQVNSDLLKVLNAAKMKEIILYANTHPEHSVKILDFLNSFLVMQKATQANYPT